MINEILEVAAYAVDVDDVPHWLLRLNTPRNVPVWYDYTKQGFELCDDESADRYEAMFKEKQA